MNLEKHLDLAITTSIKAGDYLRERKDIIVDSDAGKDIKLNSDRLSEAIIIESLSSSGIPILTEEGGYIGDESDCYWIIDPLDGTMNYYKGLDDFTCVSIALWDKTEPVLGVINRFRSGEIFTGILGGDAKLNGKPIKPSEVEEVKNAVMATGFPPHRDYSEDSLKDYIYQVQRFKKVRMLASGALQAVFVACGRIDAYFEDEIMLWDIAAAWAIVKAAGGAVYYEPLKDYKSIFRCFSTHELMEDYNA